VVDVNQWAKRWWLNPIHLAVLQNFVAYKPLWNIARLPEFSDRSVLVVGHGKQQARYGTNSDFDALKLRRKLLSGKFWN
jgi:hypothetical protein